MFQEGDVKENGGWKMLWEMMLETDIAEGETVAQVRGTNRLQPLTTETIKEILSTRTEPVEVDLDKPEGGKDGLMSTSITAGEQKSGQGTKRRHQ